MLFTAATKYHEVNTDDNTFVVPYTDEVLTIDGWKKVKEIIIGDKISDENNYYSVVSISHDNDNYYLATGE